VADQIKVTLKGSVIACTKKQKETVKSLGLKKRGSSKVLKDSPAIRGAMKIVGHLVSCEEAKS
jgi:large subunit ribosomal protein L30